MPAGDFPFAFRLPLPAARGFAFGRAFFFVLVLTAAFTAIVLSSFAIDETLLVWIIDAYLLLFSADW
jgi:hypothetical protein